MYYKKTVKGSRAGLLISTFQSKDLHDVMEWGTTKTACPGIKLLRKEGEKKKERQNSKHEEFSLPQEG